KRRPHDLVERHGAALARMARHARALRDVSARSAGLHAAVVAADFSLAAPRCASITRRGPAAGAVFGHLSRRGVSDLLAAAGRDDALHRAAVSVLRPFARLRGAALRRGPGRLGTGPGVAPVPKRDGDPGRA